MPLNLSTGVRLQPPIITLYGHHGTGKNTWAAGATAPVFIRCEDGMGLLSAPCFPIATSFDQVLSQIDSLMKEDHDRQTLVLDSLDHLEPLVWAKTIADAKNAKIKRLEDFGFGKGFNYALEYWRQLLDGVLQLRYLKGMTVILLAHSNVKEFNDPNSDTYGRYQIKLHKLASALIQEKSDAVFFLSPKVYTTTDAASTAAPNERQRIRATGDGTRVIYTGECPTYVAKNRWQLPAELPAPMVGGFQVFQNAVAASVAAATTPPTNA